MSSEELIKKLLKLLNIIFWFFFTIFLIVWFVENKEILFPNKTLQIPLIKNINY
jgi:hypothetical protein